METYPPNIHHHGMVAPLALSLLNLNMPQSLRLQY